MQYRITDPDTNEEIRRKGINTRHHVQWHEAFAGGTRIIMAVEGTAQKNLTRLIEELQASDIR